MTDEELLLEAVLSSPDDDAPRLAYADALDRSLGEGADPHPRAELIRAQILLARESFARPAAGGAATPSSELARRVAWLRATDLERDLLAAHAASFAGPIAALVDAYTFDRGFIAHVTLSAQAFLQHAALLFDRAPIASVRLTRYADVGPALFDSPELVRVRALSLIEDGLTDDDVEHLARSPHMKRLWWLDLGFNPVGMRGITALAASVTLPRLRYVGLTGARVDPRETAGYEGYSISHVDLPREGEALEATYGHIPWLHFNTESALDYPPNPCRAPPPP
ncbi:TIGR02996 domain-containing protein [Sorangium sp. So ce590]|uniref:TIGR02996 domain-containing protein n=1 Tax=unclassified Sorangium TaxID=2621164 RepID=UPI003F5E33D3